MRKTLAGIFRSADGRFMDDCSDAESNRLSSAFGGTRPDVVYRDFTAGSAKPYINTLIRIYGYTLIHIYPKPS